MISNLTRKILIGSILLAPLGFASQAMAAAGDPINNTATVAYDVGGNAQPVVESSPTGNSTSGVGNGTATTFVEDAVLNLTVAAAADNVAVSPGDTDAVLTYTVANFSNQTIDILLSAVASADPLGGTDNFDATGVQAFVESGATPGYQAGQDTAVFIDEIASGGSETVYIIGDIANTQANGDIAAYSLVAQVATGGAAGEGAAIVADDNGHTSPAGSFSNAGTTTTAGVANDIADVAATVQTVFADNLGATAAANTDHYPADADAVVGTGDVDSAGAADTQFNGQASNTSAYIIEAPTLTNTKESAVVDDPVNGTSNPKAIPGATVRYTITIANAAGGATADNVTITDAIPANTTYVPASITVNAAARTDAAGDGSDFGVTTAASITGGCGSVAAGANCVITFDVTVD